MQVRTAKVTDIRSILALSEQINRQHHLGAPMVFAPPSRSFGDSEEYWLGLMIDPQGSFFVAVKNEHVVGFLAGKVTQNKGVSFIQSHKVARVNTIVVSDEAQSQGVGKALMKSFNQWSQARGAIELRLEVMEFNQQAQSFYESLGMETQSRTMSMSLEEI
ncbi:MULTISPECIES: GNAT family N-acetyltransferase [Vibrio]|uniref:GNAT family N-acetyltransferase n=1 Tax=Vibrio splendidus TaxID=29497 RepID=A0A2N7JMZ0_VIBSP|nr:MULTISPECIES: GNAT family N-acetyltransferase [Vibrio]MCF7505664.1 GNAT family N-acetyltransferase [Vibrio sp. L3-7]PMM43252.1 GNAT family N-acetyltransferase [Vibrio splendidus]TVU61035.1 GNAT family N-acetyltransferase [Vibrio atlanticus]TVU71831.1 GNAT family N-acetyltransferase [Vibrio tasmaniensis]